MERIISKHKGDKSWKTDLSIKDRARRRKMSKTCASKALCTKRSQASETCLWKGGIKAPSVTRWHAWAVPGQHSKRKNTLCVEYYPYSRSKCREFNLPLFSLWTPSFFIFLPHPSDFMRYALQVMGRCAPLLI